MLKFRILFLVTLVSWTKLCWLIGDSISLFYMYLSVRIGCSNILMEFSNVDHGKSWKSHGILQLLRCMNPVSNLKARYVEITHSHQISIFQSSNSWTFAVQIIASAAVLKLSSFNAERIKSQIQNHHVIIKTQAA